MPDIHTDRVLKPLGQSLSLSQISVPARHLLTTLYLISIYHHYRYTHRYWVYTATDTPTGRVDCITGTHHNWGRQSHSDERITVIPCFFATLNFVLCDNKPGPYTSPSNSILPNQGIIALSNVRFTYISNPTRLHSYHLSDRPHNYKQ